jgi:N-acyl-D-aspartate/D-glutamate deacylase
MLAEVAALPAEMTAMVADFHGVMKWHPSYEPVAFPRDHHLRGVAKASGRDMYEVAYDWLCEYGCEGSLWRPLFGVHEGSLDIMGELVVHPNCSPGFGDAGAHGPGPPGAAKRPRRFPSQIEFLWRFCVGAQGA